MTSAYNPKTPYLLYLTWSSKLMGQFATRIQAQQYAERDLNLSTSHYRVTKQLTQRQIKNRLTKLANQYPGSEATAEYQDNGAVTFHVDGARYL